MAVKLFFREDLRSSLLATAKKMTDRLQTWDPDTLNAPEADVIEVLVRDGTVHCPRLLRDQVELLPPSETVQRFNDIAGRQLERRLPLHTLVVPFEGEKDVFTLRASYSRTVATVVASLGDGELRIAQEGPFADGVNARKVFDAELDSIEEQLEWSRTQIEEHNQRIRDQVPGMVSRRRAELLAARNIQAEIGFPIRRRPDADTYSVPITRRTLRPAQPRQATATPFRPEPVMGDADYEAALAVLRNARNALERTPSLAETLGEEQIRDLLLVFLNAQFEGDAAGEVFNGAGKTDILIRVADRNIFIGECKIWDGPATMDEALDQLFKYLVWRDTKAAILLFIRNKDVTAAIRKAAKKIESHPHFKRRAPSHTDDRLDFVVHADGDPQREIKLALLPFALRTEARLGDDD